MGDTDATRISPEARRGRRASPDKVACATKGGYRERAAVIGAEASSSEGP